ncbi:unnamed protein product [Gongylonema pulchrum]|uniref:UBC core domain-containing protein n=1 Tax=Gongylonema pulchrum TaxID=637853 RepID=A0A183CU91_9BILA|nr:unnamed protein product [Gongylonema pulchrum]
MGQEKQLRQSPKSCCLSLIMTVSSKAERPDTATLKSRQFDSIIRALYVHLPQTVELHRLSQDIYGETFPPGRYRFGCLFQDNTGCKESFYSKSKTVAETGFDERDDFPSGIRTSLKNWQSKNGSMTITVELFFYTKDYLSCLLPSKPEPTAAQKAIRRALVEEMDELEKYAFGFSEKLVTKSKTFFLEEEILARGTVGAK